VAYRVGTPWTIKRVAFRNCAGNLVHILVHTNVINHRKVRHSRRAHCEGKERKAERKKGQRYGNEFRRQAIDRMNACNNIVGLARELGVWRRVLYNLRDLLDEISPAPTRTREPVLRKQILKLKRLLVNKTLEVDFFRHTLQRVPL